jgi:TonB family protein
MGLRLLVWLVLVSTFAVGQQITDEAAFERQYRPALDAAASGDRDQIRQAFDTFALPVEWFQQMFGSNAEKMFQQYQAEFDFFVYHESGNLHQYNTPESVMRVNVSQPRSTINPAPKPAPTSLQPLPSMEAVQIKLVDRKSGADRASWMNLFLKVNGEFRFYGVGGYPFWDPIRIHRPDMCDPQGHQPGGRLIASLTPLYPEEARSNGVQGAVRLRVKVAKDGSVSSVDVMSGDPLLVESAIQAAKQWRYQPFINCGQPMEAQSIENVRYSLNGSNATVTIATPPSRVRVASGVALGNLVYKVNPTYPLEAKAQRIQGEVVLKAVIGKNGGLQDISVISGPTELIGAAIDAVRQWRYKPFTVNGEPVEVETPIQINFTLSH